MGVKPPDRWRFAVLREDLLRVLEASALGLELLARGRGVQDSRMDQPSDSCDPPPRAEPIDPYFDPSPRPPHP